MSKSATKRLNGSNGAAHNGNGAAPRRRSARSKQVRMTPAGIARFSARETNPCGPRIFTTRVRAVTAAMDEGGWREQAGALEDVAAAAIAWAQRIRSDAIRTYD